MHPNAVKLRFGRATQFRCWHCSEVGRLQQCTLLTVISLSLTPSYHVRLRYEQKGWTDYDEDGMPYFESNPEEGLPSESSIGADIDTVAYFSSFGPTDDGRIKPEVVAPGDRVSGSPTT